MLYAYLYDSSFAGFLSTLCAIKTAGQPPNSIIRKPPQQLPLFTEIIEVKTDNLLAAQAEQAILKHMGGITLDQIYTVNLSGHPLAPLWLYQYVELGKKLGMRLNNALTYEEVHNVLLLSRQVRAESHRLLGLVRFRLTADGIYYATITPDNHVLPLIAEHFAARFADQRWIIHDTLRQLALLGQQGKSQLIRWQTDWQLEIDDNFIEAMWQDYFQTIAIPERANPRQQASCMPKRYWHNLVENP